MRLRILISFSGCFACNPQEYLVVIYYQQKVTLNLSPTAQIPQRPESKNGQNFDLANLKQTARF